MSSLRRVIGAAVAIAAVVAIACIAIGRTGDEIAAAETWGDPHVIDGDTLDATNPDGTVERIRILGIDAPEWVACGGAEATAYLTELLAGVEEIELVRDPSQAERDKYGRVLAYVELADGTDIGLELINAGYAREYTFKSPHQRAAAYNNAEHTDLVGC